MVSVLMPNARVGVVPAHILLVHRLGVVGQGAVILPGIPHLFQLCRQGDFFGDFGFGQALVDVLEGLGLDVLVDGRGVQHVLVDHVVSPVGPVVGLEYHLSLTAEEGLGLHDVVGPGVGVPDLRAPQGVQVVHGPGAVLRHPQGLVLGQIGVHFRRGLRARGEMEYHLVYSVASLTSGVRGAGSAAAAAPALARVRTANAAAKMDETRGGGSWGHSSLKKKWETCYLKYSGFFM